MQDQRSEIQDCIIKMVNAIDTKKWDRAKACFAPKVFVDYSSMNGNAGAQVESADLVGGWEGLLAKASTHHMLSNWEIDVDSERAKVESHVYACHVAEGIEQWDNFGRYLHELQRVEGEWKISSMTLIVHGQKGNREFLAQLGG